MWKSLLCVCTTGCQAHKTGRHEYVLRKRMRCSSGSNWVCSRNGERVCTICGHNAGPVSSEYNQHIDKGATEVVWCNEGEQTEPLISAVPVDELDIGGLIWFGQSSGYQEIR